MHKRLAPAESIVAAESDGVLCLAKFQQLAVRRAGAGNTVSEKKMLCAVRTALERTVLVTILPLFMLSKVLKAITNNIFIK